MNSKEKQKLIKKYKVGVAEKKRYIFDELRDFQILCLCRKLEKLNLSTSNKQAVEMAKSQLENDWRAPLVRYLKFF